MNKKKSSFHRNNASILITAVQIFLVISVLFGDFYVRFTDIGTFSMGVGFTVLGMLLIEPIIYVSWLATNPTSKIKTIFYLSVIVLVCGIIIVVNI